MKFNYITPPSNYYQCNVWYMLGAFLFCVCLFAMLLPSGLAIIFSNWETKSKYVDDNQRKLLFITNTLKIIVLIASIIFVTFVFYTNIHRWNDVQFKVIDQVHNAVMSGKSNKYVSVKPYKNVIAFAKSKDLRSTIKDNEQYVTQKHVQKTFRLNDSNLLIKYQNGQNETFTADKTSIISRPSHTKRPIQVKVYSTKLTSAGKHYIAHSSWYLYKTRRAVITSYVKIKPIAWQKVNN